MELRPTTHTLVKRVGRHVMLTLRDGRQTFLTPEEAKAIGEALIAVADADPRS
jgi:hypothetical protein